MSPYKSITGLGGGKFRKMLLELLVDVDSDETEHDDPDNEQKCKEAPTDVKADSELVSLAVFKGKMYEVTQETASEEESFNDVLSDDWEHCSDFELTKFSGSDWC